MKDMNAKIVTFKGIPVRQFYNSKDFRMYAFDVDKKNYPLIKRTKYNNVSVVGEMQELTPGIEYEINATEENNTKYGYSYRVKNIKTAEKLKSATDMYTFLSNILTQKQADTLYNVYPDIVDRVIDGDDDIDLDKLPGIGQKSWNKIKQKIEENYAFADLVSYFNGIFTFQRIRELYNEFTSTELIKEKLSSVPYDFLTDLSHIGFTKADSYLLKMEKDKVIEPNEPLAKSKQRCKAFIVYTLKENEKEGNTKMKLDQLRKLVKNSVPECRDRYIDCIHDKMFYVDDDENTISLTRTYNIEVEIAKRLVEGLNIKNEYDVNIEEYRKYRDFELSDEQIDGVRQFCKETISIIDGPGGCVDCETEFFNGNEWKSIAEYNDSDKVLQYNADGTAELVDPIRYIKTPQDTLYHFETKYGLNQTLSLDHNVYYITSKNNLYHKTFAEVKENQEQNGFLGRFITSFKYEGSGIPLTDDEIRLCVAVFADGHFPQGTYNKNSSIYMTARVNLKKERKKKRLRTILDRMGLPYREREKCGKRKGYTEFYFVSPILSRHFPDEWYNCSKEQLEIIATEVMCWDGCIKTMNDYVTTNKKDADFIQFVLTSIGKRASISIKNRVGQKYFTNGKEYTRKSIEYTVSWTKRVLVGMCSDKRKPHKKTEIFPVKTLDGYMYCFEVPSHMLVLRRKDCIFVTGNSGKSQTMSTIVKILDDLNKSYALMAPTGRASKVLGEYTKKTASTIHRGLCYNPKEGWIYCKENPLSCEVVIVDEFSMVDVFLFKHLLDAIDFNKTKLLMVGDSAQLNSVQAGNCLHNMIDSKVIPTTTLTKIFRYDEGGLMKVATDVRLCKPYLKDLESKISKFGVNSDYVFIADRDTSIIGTTVGLYTKLLAQGKHPENIMVLSAYNKGDYGTKVLNEKLQKIANINARNGSEACVYRGTKYYNGDIVMQNVNNYKAKCYDLNIDLPTEDKTAVYNGEIGKVVRCEKNHIVIDFDGNIVVYSGDDLQGVQLGYAVSIHKSQGGSCDIVIMVTPKSHIFMLTSNLLYVGLTRMKKQFFHIGNPNAINSAVKKKENLQRETYLEQLITKEYKNSID